MQIKFDPAGIWLFKWVAGPLPAIVLVAAMISYRSQQNRCRQLAEEKGFLESYYVPSRAGLGAECVCEKKQNPDGTIDEKARIVIKL